MGWINYIVTRLAAALRSAAASLEGVLARFRAARQRRRLADLHEYVFNYDYTTSQAPVWTLHLKEFVGKPNVHLLEVGPYEGRSTLWFIENVLTDPTSTATCVDSFTRPGGEDHFDHNIKLSGAARRVSKLKGLSVDILPTLRGRTFDIIYIDGSHVAVDVLMDAFLCWPLLEHGGVLIFDDYLWEMQRPPSRRPQLAIDLFLETVGSAARVLHKEYQVLVKRA